MWCVCELVILERLELVQRCKRKKLSGTDVEIAWKLLILMFFKNFFHHFRILSQYIYTEKQSLSTSGSPWLYPSSISLVLLLLSRSVVSDSVRLHRRQPTKLLCSQDSPGKNTGVGCHFLLHLLGSREQNTSLSMQMDYYELTRATVLLKTIPIWKEIDFTF